jgi:translation initiation factor 2B subunit (eIF-2B alpha/beta/delta family)
MGVDGIVRKQLQKRQKTAVRGEKDDSRLNIIIDTFVLIPPHYINVYATDINGY